MASAVLNAAALIASLALPGQGVVLLPDFHFSSGGSSPADHFGLGLAMGLQYAEAVQGRAAAHAAKMEQVLATAHGRHAYAELLKTHERLVPHLLCELQGIAQGSNVSFRTLFAMSLEEELGYFARSPWRQRADHCSDYMLCSAARCINGHNEDGNLADRRLFTAFVRLGEANFTVLNYVGDLLGGMAALAFNSAGLAFSLNWVGPRSCTTDGLGRNFVSRLLLEAQSWEEAAAVIARKHAAGHNYQLMDFRHRRIANFEVAQDRVAQRDAIAAPFFHANQYQTLSEPGQVLSNSSLHRLERVRVLPKPQNAGDVLLVLGDQGDVHYPVFHDLRSHNRGDLSDWTLATALFDLDARNIELLQGNPADRQVLRHFAVRPARASQLLFA